MQPNTIINGDCLTILKTIPDNFVDLIFADPPYWLRANGVLARVEGTAFKGCDDQWDKQFNSPRDYELFTEKWLTECKRVLKKNGSLWVIGGMQCIYTIGGIMQKLGFWLINDVVWYKKNPTPNFRGTRLNNSHETLIWATKSPMAKYTFNYKTAKEHNVDTVTEAEFKQGVRKQLGSVWRLGVCQGHERLKDAHGKKLHSTQKPEALLYRLITTTSKIGDLVLDPFGGTLTTAVVAKKTGRQYIVIEQDKHYVKFGKQRVANAVEKIGEIEKSSFDIKPPKVKVTAMIKANYLRVNEKFYLKNKPEVAILKADAKLEYQKQIMDMHTCAAWALGRKCRRVNGFKFWYVLRNNKLVGLEVIREQYRASCLT